ncbi:fumarylacetoacetate hydrolase family protein [Pelomonas sp. SE-A7]|uniref:fumarylacetoacetate hydrolase family protein n=1 Tax=Pelomonas sp. SE-A7 TaxID=3054953 RepID=UPI00259C8E0B|nr:fumarylacetoacetate hydrolase family protein [Pelomonas sp. SE-A7]MDM4765585.1 fumarylacetoacetate hydrolase family protein [Pelomonas sp. SE-A7]
MTAAKLAEALIGAHARRLPLDCEGWALPDALEQSKAQQAVVRAIDRMETGPACWKSGGPARDAARLGHSPLPRRWLRQGHSIDVSEFWLPFCGVEAEVAFRLSRRVTAEMAATLDQAAALALCDGMAVAIELTASRWQQGGQAPAELRQADLQSHAALLVGPWLAVDSKRDWANQACEISIGYQTPVAGRHAMDDPSWLLQHWLRHATRDGASLAAGTVVTTGSWTGNLPLRPGERVVVRFQGLGELVAQA